MFVKSKCDLMEIKRIGNLIQYICQLQIIDDLSEARRSDFERGVSRDMFYEANLVIMRSEVVLYSGISVLLIPKITRSVANTIISDQAYASFMHDKKLDNGNVYLQELIIGKEIPGISTSDASDLSYLKGLYPNLVV